MQEAENTGGDPLDVEMKNPNDSRERQKLLREQNIVKQVNLGSEGDIETWPQGY